MLRTKSTKSQRQKDLLKKYLAKECRFNWASQAQVLYLLHKCLGFDCKKWDRKTGKQTLSTDDEVLKRYQGQHPVIDLLLQYRSLCKLDGYCKEWLEKVQPNGRIYSSYHQDAVRLGGRLSSSDINQQNVPRPGTTEWIGG
jgi:DNA polymerase I-like protein with 3'-5' exonuclease and polymerase domains